MFTGIIQEVAKVFSITKKINSNIIAIKSNIVYQDTKISDSINVNGVCLTVVKKEKNILFFEAIKTTLEKTNLKRLKINEYVNLEQALKISDKLGGHFVLGHIDTEAKLLKIIKKNNYWQLELELPSKFKKYVVENGSVSIDGISLTIKKINYNSFTLDIIPFTYQNTNIKYRKIGDYLNIEFDYLLKATLKNSGGSAVWI